MVAGQAFYKEIDGKWSVYESDVADKLGFYRRFTGTIDYGQTKATVKGADFGVYAQGHIVFERGTWIDGTWSGGRWEGGTWLNGVWNGGDWYNGTWKNGVWKNGMFGHDETKKSDWMNGTWENGVFETGSWHGGVWKGGKWSDWYQNFWMKGTDGNGVVHGRGECPLKWNEDSNVVIASELVRIARSLIGDAPMMNTSDSDASMKEMSDEKSVKDENFGSYSIKFDSETRTFTVYFTLKDDAVESRALENATACRDEIEKLFTNDKLIKVTEMTNNDHKSFSFLIVIDKEKKEEVKKSSFNGIRTIVAVGEGDDATDSGDSDSDDAGLDNKDADKKNNIDSKESEKFINIQNDVSEICKEFSWDPEKGNWKLETEK